MTTQFISRVRPDLRGRVVITKALEAMRARFPTPISGFDMSMTAEGDLVLRPTVDVPAAATVVLSPADAQRLAAAAAAEPNAALLAAARAYWDDRATGALRSDLDAAPPAPAPAATRRPAKRAPARTPRRPRR